MKLRPLASDQVVAIAASSQLRQRHGLNPPVLRFARFGEPIYTRDSVSFRKNARVPQFCGLVVRGLHRPARATNSSRRKSSAATAAIVACRCFVRSVNSLDPKTLASASARRCMPSRSVPAASQPGGVRATGRLVPLPGGLSN